jgi:glycosyltransferase involved in cell wall biosynthesis
MPANKQFTSPYFSIIIPTRNEETRLAYCLPSLLNQTYQNFEVLVIDDPETSDKTVDLIKSLASDKITYFQHEKDLKVPAKRNIGAKMAKGHYLYMIDADMEFPTDTLAILAQEIHDTGAELIFVPERTPGKEWISKMKDLEKQIVKDDTSLSAARLYSKAAYSEQNGYNENLIVGEEVDLSDRVQDIGAKVLVSNVEVNHYETSGASVISHFKKKFKYGMSVGSYFEAKDKDEKTAKKRAGSSRLVYFTSPVTWKNPILGLQFIVFKFTELSFLAFGLIYAKLTKKQIITTK